MPDTNDLAEPVLWEGLTHGHGAENPNASSIADQYDSVPVLMVPPNTLVRIVRVSGSAGGGVPDEPGDDDLAELRAYANRGPAVSRAACGRIADEVERLRAAAPAETIHACPPGDAGLTSCCGRTPFELPRTDRITLAAVVVTCWRAAAPASKDDERKSWTFDVQFEGGPQPTDYGTGTEWDGGWQWAIYDGPHELDDVVLSGMADDDPTAVLAALVTEHNRAGSPPPTPATTEAAVRSAIEDHVLSWISDHYPQQAPGIIAGAAAEVMELLSAAPVPDRPS